MSANLQKFIDRLQGFEARGSKDFIMPLSDAKGIHADITRLLLELQDLREQALAVKEEQSITVKMDGGSFK